MAKKKDSSIELAFNEFDTVINNFFKEATSSLENLEKPVDPQPKKQTRQPRLPKLSDPFGETYGTIQYTIIKQRRALYY